MTASRPGRPARRRRAPRRARSRPRVRPGRPGPRRSARRRGRPAPTRRRTARTRRPRRSSPRPCPARRRRACSGASPACRSPTSTTGSLPGVTQQTTSHASASASGPRPPVELVRRAPRRPPARGSWQTPGPVAGGGQAARGPGAVQPAADDPDGARVRPRERRRGDRRHRARCAARSPSARRAASAARRSRRRQADHAGHGRQPALGVARERGHPLEQRQPVAARRHRPEVAVAAGSAGTPSAASPSRRRGSAAGPRARGRSPSPAETAASTASWSRTGSSGTTAHDTLSRPPPVNRRPEAHDRRPQRLRGGGRRGRRRARALHARDGAAARATPRRGATRGSRPPFGRASIRAPAEPALPWA